MGGGERAHASDGQEGDQAGWHLYVFSLSHVLVLTTFPAGTGEHGVAMGEREYLYEELREGTVDPMKTVNKTIDPSPLNLVNPGKVRFSSFLLSCRL